MLNKMKNSMIKRKEIAVDIMKVKMLKMKNKKMTMNNIMKESIDQFYIYSNHRLTKFKLYQNNIHFCSVLDDCSINHFAINKSLITYYKQLKKHSKMSIYSGFATRQQ